MNKKELLKNLEPIPGPLVSCFEIEYPENSGEYHVFDVAHNEHIVAIGGVANVGFLPTFWIEKDDCFNLDQHLETIHEIILEALYNNEINDLKGLIEI